MNVAGILAPDRAVIRQYVTSSNIHLGVPALQDLLEIHFLDVPQFPKVSDEKQSVDLIFP